MSHSSQGQRTIIERAFNFFHVNSDFAEAMQTFCLFPIFFLLLSCALPPLSYASSALKLGRRHLSDDDDAGAAQLTPASPISPPFFPLESAAPPLPLPQPPPPATYAAAFPTFPANISALVLPRSPKPHSTSPALLVPAISAVLVVATVLGVALFLYGRWKGQNRHSKDTATTSLRSGSSSSHSHTHGYEEEEEERHVITTNNFSVSASSPTSEVLYLGGEDEPNRVITSFTKPPESPEIRPLPPLPRSFQPSYEADERNNNEEEEEEEEEEFFSPLASLSCSPNSSPSRSVFEQTSSSSSSGWVSPARSFSMTLSPIQQQRSFSRLSDVSFEQSSLQSPSPERLTRARRNGNNNGHGSSSLRMFSFFNQNLSFPRISSASTSPDRGGFVRTPLSSLYSSVSNSPDGLFRKFINSSPPVWNDFSRNVKSVLLSSESVSSRRDFVINIGGQAAAPLPPPTRPPPLVPPSQSFVVQNDVKKPSFSDKLNQGSCQNTAWDCLKTSSFKLNKEIVETLFISNSSSPNVNQRGLTYELPSQSEVLYQNIATRLQLLNLTTKDVCNALLEGDSGVLGAELLDCLSRLAPSKEEERKLRNASDDSVFIKKLGPAERFLKELLQVPFVFKRVEALLSVANFYPEVEYLRRSFGVVQAACEELRNNKTFSRLLEAILKTGNKMSVGTNSHAFKFDTLLKLAEVKGLDGRSTVLHFVVQEMIKSEGSVKALDRVRNLSSEMETVKKSADIEYGVLTSGVLKLCQVIKNIKELLTLSEESGCSGDQWLRFEAKMTRFLETGGEEILRIKAQESSTLSALEEVTELFHGGSFKEEGRTSRVFMAVKDFLSTLDEVCNDMGDRFSA